MLRTYTFPVDVFCGACTPHVESLIRDTRLKIKKIHTDIVNKITRVDVEVDPLIEDQVEALIRSALSEGGRLLEAPEPIQPELNSTPTDIPIAQKPRWLSWLLGGIGIISGVAMLAIMLSGITLPVMVMVALGVTSAALSLALGGNTIYRAITNLIQHRSVSMETLYALGAIAAIGATIGHLFVRSIPMLFDAALLIFGFKHLGDGIKEHATRPTQHDKHFTDRAKIRVVVEPTGDTLELNKIPVGSIIRVPRGSIIPIDGVLLDDEAYFYETVLNGQDGIQRYRKDQEVLSGCRIANSNATGEVRLKTLRSAQDSHLSQLDKCLSLEKQQKPQLSALTDRILRWFIPIVIGIAVIASLALAAWLFPVVGLAGAAAIGIKCFIAVIVSACPCTLGLTAPLSANTGMQKAKAHQLYFKDDEKLQAAAQSNLVLFDLNGTLTVGKPIVKTFHTTKNRDKGLAAALALEMHSHHAFAKSIQQYAKATARNIGTETAEQVIVTRIGISGLVNGQRFTIGNATMMQHAKLNIERYLRDHAVSISPIQQLIYLADENDIIGHFIIEDPIRHGAKETIRQLHTQGYEVAICTGATEKTAQAYAQELNIKRVFADCKNIADQADTASVTTKFSVVKRLQAEGKQVAMIGDAGNDAIPIAASHFGAAMKSASSDDITLNTADAVIESDSLLPVVAMFEIAKQTATNIKQSMITSLSVNSLSIVAAITGTALTALGFVFPPAIGAGLMVLLLVPIFANVARLKNQALPYHAEASRWAALSADVCTTAGLKQSMALSRDANDRPVPLADARGSDNQTVVFPHDPSQRGSDDLTETPLTASNSYGSNGLTEASPADVSTAPDELSRARQQAVSTSNYSMMPQ